MMMDEKVLARILKKHSKGTPRRRMGCLDELEIAAFADKLVSAQDKKRIEAHLADCPSCLSQVAFLIRIRRVPLPHSVPGKWLERARALPQAFGWRSLLGERPWVPVAVSAVGMLVVFVSLWNVRREPPAVVPVAPATTVEKEQAPTPPKEVSPTGPEAELRKTPGTIALPSLMFPTPGSTVSRREMQFRWQPVPSTLYYEVQLLTEEGSIVWELRTTETSVTVPLEVNLAAGQKYLVWVRAYSRGGKSSRSKAVAFTVGDSG